MVARNNIYLPGTLAIYLLFLLLCRTIYIKKYIELLGLKYLIINTFKVFTKMHISCVDKQKETLGLLFFTSSQHSLNHFT